MEFWFFEIAWDFDLMFHCDCLSADPLVVIDALRLLRPVVCLFQINELWHYWEDIWLADGHG